VIAEKLEAIPDTSANGGRRQKGQRDLPWGLGTPHRRSRRAFRGGRSLDQIRDRFG
jgi:hypothetical protein